MPRSSATMDSYVHHNSYCDIPLALPAHLYCTVQTDSRNSKLGVSFHTSWIYIHPVNQMHYHNDWAMNVMCLLRMKVQSRSQELRMSRHCKLQCSCGRVWHLARWIHLCHNRLNSRWKWWTSLHLVCCINHARCFCTWIYNNDTVGDDVQQVAINGHHSLWWTGISCTVVWLIIL